MARVLIRTQAWGPVIDRAGNALPSLTYALKNTDGSAATHWSAQTGGSSSTATLTTDAFGVGTLSGADRWVEQGEYDLVTNGNTYRVEALNAASVVSASSQSSPLLYVDAFGAIGNGSTDDTAALQNAVNAAGAIGASTGRKCPLVMTPGKNYFVSTYVIPQSYVDIWGYGAAVSKSGADNHAIFETAPYAGIGTAVDSFAIRGLTNIGTGSEASLQYLLFAAQASRITVENCFQQNNAAGLAYILDSQYIWIDRNIVLNGSTNSAGNTVNLVSSTHGNTTPLKYVWVRGNYIESKSVAINFAQPLGGTRTDPVVDGHVEGNTCILLSGVGWPIGIEQGASGGQVPDVQQFDFSGNTCIVQGGSGIYAMALAVAGATTPGALNIARVKVRGNTLISNQASALLCQASRCSIVGNELECTGNDIVLSAPTSNGLNRITVAGNNGRTAGGTNQLVSISANIDFATLSISGNTRFGGETVAVPASASAVSAVGRNRTFYVTAATGGCTMTLQDGKAIVIPAAGMGTVVVPAGQTVTPTYTNAPTWLVEGD